MCAFNRSGYYPIHVFDGWPMPLPGRVANSHIERGAYLEEVSHASSPAIKLCHVELVQRKSRMMWSLSLSPIE